MGEDFKKNWKDFKQKLKDIEYFKGFEFEYLINLLEKHLKFVPSSAYKDIPDISLFDHSKTVCAIALCLLKNQKVDVGFLNKTLLILSNIFKKEEDLKKKLNVQKLSMEIKEKALAKANEIFDSSESAVFVHFNGMPAEDTREMRAKMTSEGVGYSVIKKTLIKNAAAASKVEGEIPVLDGEIALAYSDSDATVPARLVKEFAKSTKNKVQIVGGVFEGKFQDQEQMNAIADIPSLDVLRGMFVNVINSPIQRTAIALSEIAKAKA